ncbi:MAG: hypothetical protein WCS69_00410 [Ignavibacteriaceae bacterium]|jgi:hypothetical protein
MDSIKKYILQNLISAILTLIGMAIVGLWLLFQPGIIQFLLPLKSGTIFGFGWILSILLLVLMLAIAYIIYLKKELKNQLFSACSVYWDKYWNPVCPSCKNLLGNYGFYTHNLGRRSEPGCKCLNCKHIVHFSDDEKIFMTLEEAREKAKKLYSNR